MNRFLYQFGFAIIDWLSATVCLCTLGIYIPDWPMRYVAWAGHVLDKLMENLLDG